MFRAFARWRARRRLLRMSKTLVIAVAFLDSRLDFINMPRAERREMFRTCVNGSTTLADVMEKLAAAVYKRMQ